MKRFGLLTTAVVLILAVSVGTALAAKPDGTPGNGPGASSGPTEDTDDDGVPNCPDPDGDLDNKHPSGKDRHCEAGKSGNQGKAQSDPDDDSRGPDRSNGGVDQPGGSGGKDQLDQDGNNGCGNDDDFEDDNEGLCLGPKKISEPPRVEPPSEPPTENPPLVLADEGVKTEVLGVKITAAAVETEVLGARITALPTTGASGVVPLLLLSVSLISLGTLLLFRGRRRPALY